MRDWIKTIIAAAALAAATAPIAAADSPRERANRDTVGIMGGSVRGTYSQFAQNLADALDEEGQLRIIAQLGRGSKQNIADLLWLRGVDVAIVQSDVLKGAQDGIPEVENIQDKIQYIMKLYNEEIHILARKGVTTIKELYGERVSIGGNGSGTAMTAGIVFDSLGIDIEPVNMSNSEAVAAVREGKIAGAVFVVGKPAGYFSDIRPDEGVSLLRIEIDRQLEDLGYLSSTFTSEDYPNLVAGGQRVESIAVGAVMAAYNWKPTTSRYERVRTFVQALIQALPRLRSEKAFHAKWKDVDPYATVPGWTRLQAAREVLGQ